MLRLEEVVDERDEETGSLWAVRRDVLVGGLNRKITSPWLHILTFD